MNASSRSPAFRIDSISPWSAPDAIATGDGGGLGGSYGKTDKDGRYTLRTVAADKSGAAVGKHKVAISLSQPDPKNPEGAAKDLIPAKYNAKSDLTFDVPSGGTDKADFALNK